MIKAVIFDCGRVFLHDPDNEIIFQDWAKSCGLDYKIVEPVGTELLPLYQTGTLNDTSFWQEFQRRTGLAELPPDHQEFWTRTYLPLTRIDYDVLSLVKELHQLGIRTPVLSNTIPPHVRANRRRGLFNLFDPEIFSYEVGSRKPDKKIYEIALEQSGNPPPQETVYVDDLPKYLEAAVNLGLKGVHYQNCPQLRRELQTLGIQLK